MAKPKQAHNHPPEQMAMFPQERAIARRTDPITSRLAAASVARLRDSHRWVLRLFEEYGRMTDEEAWETHESIRRRDGQHFMGPRMSPSGLRSRRAELTPPRGRGIRDSGERIKTATGRLAIVWERDR